MFFCLFVCFNLLDLVGVSRNDFIDIYIMLGKCGCAAGSIPRMLTLISDTHSFLGRSPHLISSFIYQGMVYVPYMIQSISEQVPQCQMRPAPPL